MEKISNANCRMKREKERDSFLDCQMRLWNDVWTVSVGLACETLMFKRKPWSRAFYARLRMQSYSAHPAVRWRWRCRMCAMCMCGMWVSSLVRRLRRWWHGCNWNMNFCDMLGWHCSRRCRRRSLRWLDMQNGDRVRVSPSPAASKRPSCSEQCGLLVIWICGARDVPRKCSAMDVVQC